MKHAGSLIRIPYLFLLVFILGSCSQYQKLLKSDDNELKFSKAIEYYEDEQYSKAITLLADIIPAYRGTARAESLNYYYALAHYKMRDYTLASHYLSSFSSAFPNSEHVEEFVFLSAYSKYLESPRPSLDQSSTMEAIRELQSFINRFPASERVEEANELIDELRFKLETKRYNKATMYLRISDYIAAATTFENLIRDFPDTEYREEALYNIILSHFEYADQSIIIRQTERFEEVLKAYQRLVRFFPESQYLANAERMRNIATNRIEEIRKATEVSEH
jgi:outer membrane protein assembly factor BamD